MSKTASASAMARFVDLSRERLRQLAEEGVVTRSPGGGYDLEDTTRSYVRWLRDRPVRSAKHDALYEARTRILELKEAKLRGTMMPTEGVDALIAETFSELIGMLYAAIAKKSRDRDERLYWRNTINEARNAFADKMSKRADALALEKDTDNDEAA
jgi:DNA-binding FadR family transcriptional regulator